MALSESFHLRPSFLKGGSDAFIEFFWVLSEVTQAAQELGAWPGVSRGYRLVLSSQRLKAERGGHHFGGGAAEKESQGGGAKLPGSRLLGAARRLRHQGGDVFPLFSTMPSRPSLGW